MPSAHQSVRSIRLFQSLSRFDTFFLFVFFFFYILSFFFFFLSRRKENVVKQRKYSQILSQTLRAFLPNSIRINDFELFEKDRHCSRLMSRCISFSFLRDLFYQIPRDNVNEGNKKIGERMAREGKIG